MPENIDALFRQYHRELHSLAYRRLGQRELAADVVQDAFVRYADMIKTPTCGAAVENPRSFLWRIVVNLVTDLGRRDRRRGDHADLDDILDWVADPRPAPDKALENRQQLALLRAALDELPKDCRNALLLSRRPDPCRGGRTAGGIGQHGVEEHHAGAAPLCPASARAVIPR
jgi:RNA polymerase sigma factor (sigma-70 family)